VAALGSLGFFARAFVFAMIGVFLLFAAIHFRSSEAKGFAGALRIIQQQPYGLALLGITAVGCSLSVFTELPRPRSAGSHLPGFNQDPVVHTWTYKLDSCLI
jgi:hypothetical protein